VPLVHDGGSAVRLASELNLEVPDDLLRNLITPWPLDGFSTTSQYLPPDVILIGLMGIAFQAPGVGLVIEPVASWVVGFDVVPVYTPTMMFVAVFVESK